MNTYAAIIYAAMLLVPVAVSTLSSTYDGSSDIVDGCDATVTGNCCGVRGRIGATASDDALLQVGVPYVLAMALVIGSGPRKRSLFSAGALLGGAFKVLAWLAPLSCPSMDQDLLFVVLVFLMGAVLGLLAACPALLIQRVIEKRP